MLSARLLKSQSADSLLNSDMDTAPPQAAPSNHTWLDGIGQAGAKDMDAASSAHSNQNSPQTHDAYLSLLTNKGIATNPDSVSIIAFVNKSYTQPYLIQ